MSPTQNYLGIKELGLPHSSFSAIFTQGIETNNQLDSPRVLWLLFKLNIKHLKSQLISSLRTVNSDLTFVKVGFSGLFLINWSVD